MPQVRCLQEIRAHIVLPTAGHLLFLSGCWRRTCSFSSSCSFSRTFPFSRSFSMAVPEGSWSQHSPAALQEGGRTVPGSASSCLPLSALTAASLSADGCSERFNLLLLQLPPPPRTLKNEAGGERLHLV